jgi:hypothetical protein
VDNKQPKRYEAVSITIGGKRIDTREIQYAKGGITVGGDPSDQLQAEASDPMTPGPRLLELAAVPTPAVRSLARRNPSLPNEELQRLLLWGDLDAWQNPMAELLMLDRPGPAWARGARYAVNELAERLPWLARLCKQNGPVLTNRMVARLLDEGRYRAELPPNWQPLSDVDARLIARLACVLGRPLAAKEVARIEQLWGPCRAPGPWCIGSNRQAMAPAETWSKWLDFDLTKPLPPHCVAPRPTRVRRYWVPRRVLECWQRQKTQARRPCPPSCEVSGG